MPPGLLMALALIGAGDEPPAPMLELRDGDRVVMIGDALFEGDHELGLVETALTARHPGLNLTFRNLGRTGDTVRGDSRAGFETSKEGFERRAALVGELKPTVVLVGYGMNESFAGAEGLDGFRRDLVATLDSLSPTGARVVLVTPIVHEDLGPPLPDPNAHNAELARYTGAIRELGRERGLPVVDLHGRNVGNGMGKKVRKPRPETVDGIHLNARGYENMAFVAGAMLGGRGSQPMWGVELDEGLGPVAVGVVVEGLVRTAEGVRFRATAERLPMAIVSELGPDEPDLGHSLRVVGLGPGTHALKVDGVEVARGMAEEWSRGVTFRKGPDFEQLEALRRAVVAKNRLLFDRYRPQNETYLFGFRKHEQGRNAAEIALFDPLVAEKEAEIARLRVPVAHTYELTRVEEGK
jgi:lysophospholipase L1-like esterase